MSSTCVQSHSGTTPPSHPLGGLGCSKPPSLGRGGGVSLPAETYFGRGVDSSHIVAILEGGPKGRDQCGQGKHQRQLLQEERSQ